MVSERENQAAFGRATYKEVIRQSKLRVYLYPQVYPQRVFEERVVFKSATVTFSSIKTYLKNFISFFK